MRTFFKQRPFILFLAPVFIIYTLFVIYPIIAAARISLFQWNGIGDKIFVGLGNYVELFTNQELMSQMTNALSHSLILFVLTVLIQLPIQIIMAYMIYTKAKGKNFFQVAVFSPQFISTPVIVFMFTLLFDGNIGLVNRFLEMVGLGQYARPWLGTPSLGIYIVWVMIAWAGMGVGMMYMLGAMKMVPYDSLESAYIEGAGFWRRLFFIVIPQVKMTIFNLALLAYIFGMTIFDYSYILGGTEGGINGNMDVMSLFFYRMAFGDTNPLGGSISKNSMGMGTTIACVLFLIIFLAALAQILLVYRKEEDHE